jgi:hypothetical protein
LHHLQIKSRYDAYGLGASFQPLGEGILPWRLVKLQLQRFSGLNNAHLESYVNVQVGVGCLGWGENTRKQASEVTITFGAPWDGRASVSPPM